MSNEGKILLELLQHFLFRDLERQKEEEEEEQRVKNSGHHMLKLSVDLMFFSLLLILLCSSSVFEYEKSAVNSRLFDGVE